MFFYLLGIRDNELQSQNKSYQRQSKGILYNVCEVRGTELLFERSICARRYGLGKEYQAYQWLCEDTIVELLINFRNLT